MRVRNLKFDIFLLLIFFSNFVRANYAVLEHDEKIIVVKIAETSEEKKKGFMFIKNLKEFSGMLFIYEKPKLLSFWMKNTYLDLIIIFIDSNKKITQIEKGSKLTKNLITSRKKVYAVLELPFNCSKKLNFKIGDIITWKKTNKNDLINYKNYNNFFFLY